LKWNSNGSCLLLKERESFCCATIISALPEEEPDQSWRWMNGLTVCLAAYANGTGN
jgi:hypothetical protein